MKASAEPTESFTRTPSGHRTGTDSSSAPLAAADRAATREDALVVWPLWMSRRAAAAPATRRAVTAAGAVVTWVAADVATLTTLKT